VLKDGYNSSAPDRLETTKAGALSGLDAAAAPGLPLFFIHLDVELDLELVELLPQLLKILAQFLHRLPAEWPAAALQLDAEIPLRALGQLDDHGPGTPLAQEGDLLFTALVLLQGLDHVPGLAHLLAVHGSDDITRFESGRGRGAAADLAFLTPSGL